MPPVSARKHLRIFPGRQRATTGSRTDRQSLALATLWFENETRVTALAAEVTAVRVAFLLTLHLAGRTVLVRGFVVPGIRRSGGSSWGFTVFDRVNTLGASCKHSDHRGIRGYNGDSRIWKHQLHDRFKPHHRRRRDLLSVVASQRSLQRVAREGLYGVGTDQNDAAIVRRASSTQGTLMGLFRRE